MSEITTLTGTIEHLDPHTLTIEDNVRPTAPITPAFVQSIKENGVLTPVLGHRCDDGTVTVRAGQRRVYAAREAGLTTIPVYLVEADSVTAERIVQQMWWRTTSAKPSPTATVPSRSSNSRSKACPSPRSPAAPAPGRRRSRPPSP